MKMELLKQHCLRANLPTWFADLTVAELIDAAHKPSAANKRYWEECAETVSYGDNNYFGYLPHPRQRTAEALVSEGWPEGAKHMQAFYEALRPHMPEPKSIRRRKVWTDEGDELDRDKVYSGQLDTAWRRTVRQDARGPQHITLVSQWGAAWHHTKEELLHTGAATAAIADMLTEAGYIVTVQGLMYSKFSEEAGYGAGCIVRCTLKDADELMRPDAIATVLAHCGVFRTVGFQILKAAPYKVRLGHNAWNQPIEEAIRALRLHGYGDDADILIPQAHSQAEAIRIALNVLRQIEYPVTAI